MAAPPNGIVYLVGAGPGDPGLLTRRGAELLSRADVVLYDRLVHPDLLKLAPQARLVDVGKRSRSGSSDQATINSRLVSEAAVGHLVVRLKGGDPFVFGRGGEEAEFLDAAGVTFEVVPGVTSAIAAPAYAGIPLTHRDHASWAAIATGHQDSRQRSALDWKALARAPTAVFLMGMERLDHIADELQKAGRSADTPAAVIAWATWPRQRVVRSTLGKIASVVREGGVGPPAVVVVGDVVALGDRLDWVGRRPLAGKRVFVTRARAQAGRLGALLHDAGAEVLEFPAIKVVAPPSFADLDDAIIRFDEVQWIVFSSTNVVEAVWDRVIASGRDARAFGRVRIAAVGPATAAALRARGLVADLIPPTFTSVGLAEGLGRPAKGSRGRARRILLPRGTDAPDDLEGSLRRNGWRCETVPAYETVVDSSSVSEGRAALDDGVDAVLFTAGSTVRNFVDLWGKPSHASIVCCMGPRTASVAEELHVRVDAVAAEQTLEGLVAALVAAVGR